jgi:hypothetical protein
MVTSSRPNFFLLLGLNPDVAWEQTAFDKILRNKRSEWSRQSAGVAKKALVARQNLALIPKIQLIMTDQELRTQEAADARTELASARAAEIAQFEKQLAFMNAKEFVEEEEVSRFVDAFKHLFTPAEVMNRIEVTIGQSAAAATDTPSGLDPSIARSIVERLQFLHMKTLYEFLQCSNKTATRELFRAAKKLYTKLVLLSPTAEVTAKVELAGLARDIFKSDEMRSRYDESVRQESLKWLFKELDESMTRSTNKEVHEKQVMLFLDQARKDGWKEEEALSRLKEHVRLHKWIMTVPSISLDAQKILCPACECLNDPTQRYCAKCKQELYIDCPDCGRRVSCEFVACGNCGFAVGNRYLVDSLLEGLRELLRTNDLQQAWETVVEAEQAWRPDFGTRDARMKQIKTHKAALDSLASAHQQARKDAIERLNTLKIKEVITGTQHTIHISWTPLKKGTVVILKSAQTLHADGSVLPEAQLDQLGERLETQGDIAIDSWSPSQVVYYTPFILLNQRAYIGSSQRYICVENVRDLKCQNFGSVLRLCWIWPDDCQEVRVSYSTQTWPEEDNPMVKTHLLSRTEYDLLGHYDIHEIINRDYYIVVSAIKKYDDEQVPAQGLRVLVRQPGKMVITYAIKTSAIFRRKQLHLITNSSNNKALPALLLVSKQGGLPFGKTDGEVLHRIEAGAKGSKSLIVDLPNTPLPPKTFGKLFLEDDTAYNEFMVHHPAKDLMRLS